MAVLSEFSRFTKRHKLNLAILALIKFLLLGAGLVSPLLFRVLVDDVVIMGESGKIVWVCIGLLVVYLFETACLAGQTHLSNKVFGRLLFDIRHQMLKTIMKMAPRRLERYTKADLKNRLDKDIESVERLYKNQIIEYAYNYIILISMGITLLLLNWKLALFGFLMIPISFWIMKRVGEKNKKLWDEFRDTWGDYENSTKESLESWTDIKLLSMEKKVSLLFTKHWHKMSKQQFNIQMLSNAIRSLLSIKDFFITKMNLYFVGGLLIIAGELTIGTLLIFMRYYEQIFVSLGNIQTYDIEFKGDEPMLERIIAILREETTAKNFHGKSLQLSGYISIKNLHVKNEHHDDILKNISLEIFPKQCLAIVGPSGSGKTSLLRSLIGLQPKVSGDITFDGLTSKELHEHDLFSNVGVVMQDPILFDTTIRENLLLANPGASEEEIVEACKQAGIHDDIANMPNGYDTLAGEQGRSLSGGQRQRLAIARALIKNPQILLFDESTSSLDSESEDLILGTIKELSKEKTVIMVTHRFNALLISDRVIVMDQGKIVEDSTHTELLNNRFYHNLLVDGNSLSA